MSISPPLFKYMRKEYVQSFLERGSLRLGTLHNFQKVEEYGGAIGDVYEGTAVIGDHITHMEYPEIKRHPLLGSLIKVSEPDDGMYMYIENMTISLTNDSPDCYLYCTTSEPSFENMQEFGYDVCVKIDDSVLFFKLLTDELTKQGYASLGEFWPCKYGDRRMSLEDAKQVPPHFLKAPEFAYQAEVRMAWEPIFQHPLQPHGTPIHPFTIECPSICNFLSLYDPQKTDGEVSSQVRHALKFDDEGLLQETELFVDEMSQLLARKKEATRPHLYLTNVQVKGNWERARKELEEGITPALISQARALIQDYANRGLRDPRAEGAVEAPLAGQNYAGLAASLQRLGELLEIRLARKQNRTMTVERERAYRFWYNGMAEWFIKLQSINPADQLILQAHEEAQDIPPTPKPPDYSPSRYDFYMLDLELEVRQKLARLTTNSETPPSEVIDALYRK